MPMLEPQSKKWVAKSADEIMGAAGPLKSPSKNWVAKSADEIMGAAGPLKTAKEYQLQWEKFEEFRKSTDKPQEEDYLQGCSKVLVLNFINFENEGKYDSRNLYQAFMTFFVQYFNYLHDGKKFKASTLWKTYGMLNHKHQAKYGSRLQLWPRIKMLLKRYNQG